MARTRSGRGERGPQRDLEPVQLPKPAFKGRAALAKVLALRRTTREISDKPLPLQMLADLLWAAYGVNRKKGPFGMPGRTAASASNSQEIDLYIVLADGAYLYDASRRRLTPVAEGDLRPLAISHGQGGGEEAPVRLVYVADVDRLVHTSGFQEPGLRDPDVQRSYYYVDTGLIAANVYLFAAAYGLAAWFHNCEKPALSAALRLRPDQRVLFAQTVGFPAKRGR